MIKGQSKEAPQKLLLEEYIFDNLKAEETELKVHAADIVLHIKESSHS